jgi:hypothetical protein
MEPRLQLLAGCLAAALAGLIACGPATQSFEDPNGPNVPSEPGTKKNPPPRKPDDTSDGGCGVGERGKEAGAPSKDGGRPHSDAATTEGDAGADVGADPDASDPDASDPDALPGDDASPGIDAGDPDTATGSDSGTVTPPDACGGPLAASDLAIVELMIASKSGTGDRGEWFEVQSTRACSLNLNGLHAEVLRGPGDYDSVDVTHDVWVAPNSFVVIADSADPSVNNSLPGVVLALDFAPSDVLPDSGATINLWSGATLVDTLAYPTFTNATPGRTVSFPSDCAWSDRSSWARWSYSFRSWTPGFDGTPNADNDDVACY